MRKLLDAAATTLAESGYAASSVQVICDRAGVSQGALFGHFETREALMAAVGEDVGRKTLQRYRRDIQSLRGEGDPLVRGIRLLRARCRSRLNLAWYELAMAARTSPSLRRSLRPVAAAYYADIERLARDVFPELAETLGDRFRVVVDTIVAIFDGEMLHRFVLPEPETERARLEMFVAVAGLARRKK
jgi:AcrR family transcriptional regulator